VKKAKSGGSKGTFYGTIAAAALIGVALLAWLATRSGGNAYATLDPNLPPVKAEGYQLGNPNAPVEILEFADFECPGCGSWATLQEPDVRAKLINTGQARFRFFDFPVTETHRNSLTASLGAACANDQGKFWEMHDLLFQTQDQWSTQYTSNPRKVINGLAQRLSLDMSQFAQCMDSKKHQARIKAHADEAGRLGVNSTPSFVIGGKVYPGMRYDDMKRVVDEAGARLRPAASGTSTAATPAAGKR
jgi:protein-disulfide isomerase